MAAPETVGLYESTNASDTSGVPVATSPPSFIAQAGIHYGTESPKPWPDIQAWDYSPDASRIVADHNNYLDLWVITLSSGSVQTVFKGNASSPSWSPGSGRIAFHLSSSAVPYGAIATAAPDGSAYKVLVKARAGYGVFSPSWSPDSANVLYTQSCEWTETVTYDVYRVGATSGSSVNLTKDLPGFADSIAWR